jgi:hypothetical protein
VGTAIYVTVDFAASVQMDQIRVTGSVAGDDIGPQLLPDSPERMLSTGETFRVLLPSAPDESEAALSVEGLLEGTRVALGTSQVVVHEGGEVDVSVYLEPASETDGGVPDGGTPDAGFCPNCADGCCMNGFCTTSTFNTCGSGGVACVMCDRQMTDTCAPEGACTCGRGPACDPRTADRCVAGLCGCGFSAPCRGDHECVSGKCT